MDEIDLAATELTTIRGLGKGKLTSIIKGLGGPEEFLEALGSGDVERISSLDGISQRMAVEMVLVHRGVDPGSLLRTDAARQVYDSIMEVLRSYMHSDLAVNRASLLVPGGNISSSRSKAAEIHSHSSLLEGRDRNKVEELLRTTCSGSTQVKRRKMLPYILLVEDDEALEVVRRRGLDGQCLVISPDEVSPGLEQDMILVHSKREMDEEMLPIIASVHCNAPIHEILPEMAMADLEPLLSRIKGVSILKRTFDEEERSSRMVELVEELSGLSGSESDPDVLKQEVEGIRKEVEASLKGSITDLTLTGEDALTILSSGETNALKEVYRDHARMAADLVRSRIGVRSDLFRMRYPLEIDEEALEAMISSIKDQAAGERFDRKVTLAREIVSLKGQVLEELKWALDLDWRFGLGCFVHDLGLEPFEVSDGFLAVKGSADIHLRKEGQYQAVDYHLGPVPDSLMELFPDHGVSDSRTAMLTGANSGGKTTLLLTLAQVVIMAKMGLPVPARKAWIPEIDKLFIYKPKRRLDAGGLEAFLRELLPLSTKVDPSSLVLADELEAMTELEAASRIIGIFLEELSSRGAYSVVVTHMADEICRFTECRVDGIEARGLDEKHNLIVDRTPVIGMHARSTPELILRKLEARARGDEKKIYSRVLESFE